MKSDEVKRRAFAMPLTNPSYPPGPYRFVDREFLIITYKTDLDALRAVVPEPLEVTEPLVKFEFIRMPDSTGFGDYAESGQVIPVTFRGEPGGYVHVMYLNDEGPIAGGRELWGFPKKLAAPRLAVETDTLLGTLDYGPVRIATGSMAHDVGRVRVTHGKRRWTNMDGLFGQVPLRGQAPTAQWRSNRLSFTTMPRCRAWP